MKRCYLRKGDRSTAGGIVIEGMSDSICDGVELSFVGAKVDCPACNSVGTILARGPRLPDNWMGNQLALENDLCACKCYPPPLIQASQSAMFEYYQTRELAKMGFGGNRAVLGSQDSVDEHWIRFQTSEAGRFEGMRCAAHFVDGTVAHGVFDSDNVVHFARSNNSACHKVEFIFDKRAEGAEPVTGILLAMIAGVER